MHNAIKSTALIVISSFTKKNIKHSENYSVLLLKRHSNSRSFASQFVFPGGVLDEGDLNPTWKDYFVDFNSKNFDLLGSKTNFQSFNHKTSEELLSCKINYRICAIRETFEETGILLGIDDKGNSIMKSNDFQCLEWKEIVSKDKDGFINLCKKYNFIPNIYDLKEWSEWLTPVHIKRRFLTPFFITFIDEKVPVIINADEAHEVVWNSPSKLLYEYFIKSNQLAPPQIYELNVFRSIENWNILKKKADFRNKNGGLCNFVVRLVLKDGICFVLYGDSRYPNEYPNADINLSELTFNDISSDTKQRRIYMTSDNERRYVSNLEDDELI